MFDNPFDILHYVESILQGESTGLIVGKGIASMNTNRVFVGAGHWFVFTFFVLAVAHTHRALADGETPDWVHSQSLIRADELFFYARASAPIIEGNIEQARQLARQYAKLEFAELIQTHIKSILLEVARQNILGESYSANASIVASSDTTAILEATTEAAIKGAHILHEHVGRDVLTVLMRVSRSAMPAYLKVIPSWKTRMIEGGAIAVTDKRADSLIIPPVSDSAMRVDDVVDIVGRDSDFPFERKFGLGRLEGFGADGVALDVLDADRLPVADYLVVNYRSQTGLGIGLQGQFLGASAPALTDFGLNHAAVSSAFGLALPIEWNLGRYIGISEFWLYLAPAVTFANPVLSGGFDLGFAKRFRVRQFTFGFGGAVGGRWHELDTRGSTLTLNGSSPNGLSQFVFGGAIFGDFAWDISVEWSLMLRVGWRLFDSSREWIGGGTAFDLGYSFDESGLLLALSVRYRF